MELNWQMINAAVKDEQFNLMMAAQNLADVVAYYEGQGGHDSINRFGIEGAFLPLEDLINEHAPNLKAAILDDPDVRSGITASDGNIYFVPMLSAINAARGWFIRYDWLEAVDMEIPTTVEELYDVLVAFRDQDPNGNGKADEIPSVFRRRGDDPFYNLGALSYAFDADMGWVDRDGTVVYGPTEPQYVDFVEYLRRLYLEKLIDQEHFTRQGNPRDELFGKNQAGVIHDWFASTADLNTKLADSIPGFNLRHMAPPVSGDVEPFTRIQMSRVRADGGWSISSASENPLAALKLMDYVISDEGRRLTNFGIEGVHYTMENGVPTYTEFVTNNPEGLGMHEALVTIGAQWKVGMEQDADYEAQFANEIAFDARKDYMDNYIVTEFPALSFTTQETEVLKDKFSQIQTLVSELTSRAVVGGLTMDQFKTQMQEIDRMGIAQVTEIYQRAYDRKFN
jgi:putative aldouronate transport system substrate-binding protein